MTICKTIILILLLTISTDLFAQTIYNGYIGTYPIELVTQPSSGEKANAIYYYKKFHTPIVINGIEGIDTLALLEKDRNGKNIAILTFLNFDKKKKVLIGTWTNLTTKQVLPIRLYKEFDFGCDDCEAYKEREIIQPVSLEKYYFKLVVTHQKDNYSPSVSGIKILQKQTDKLIQFFKVECDFLGLYNIEVDDYNFDGLKDFSIFQTHGAGPNTLRIYYLYNPKTRKFYKSEIDGVSLEFDQKTKRIFEHSQCCAGRIQTTSVYKIVKNKMVLLEKHCYTWSDEKQEIVESKWKDCE